MRFNPKNHGHYYNEKRLLGVTTALGIISKGDGLIQWAANQAVDFVRLNQEALGDPETLDLILRGAKVAWKQKKQEAADIGTLAHNWIEGYLKGEDPPLPENPQARNSCEAAVKWISLHEWRTIKIEQQLYLPDLGIAGICDWYAEIDGVLSVPDWKTSKSVYPSYRYQTAAYLKALENETGDKIPHRWILRIDKETGEFEDKLCPEEDIDKDYAAFEAAVTLYRREAELKYE